MDIRTAILKAADHIEQTPGALNYFAGEIPSSLRGRGCLIAWVCHFAGLKGRIRVDSSPIGFGYRRLQDFSVEQRFSRRDDWDWQASPTAAAAFLRLYADKYHPAEYVRDEAAAADFLTALNKLIRQPVQA